MFIILLKQKKSKKIYKFQKRVICESFGRYNITLKNFRVKNVLKNKKYI